MISCVYVSNDNVQHFVAAGAEVSEFPVTGIGTGSCCYAADTKKLYIFHAGTGQWYEQPAGTGGVGVAGADGKDGVDGKDGYTPVKGVDYWTAEDIAEIRAYVETAIEEGEW